MLISEPVTSLSSGFEYVFKIEIEVFLESREALWGGILFSICPSCDTIVPRSGRALPA